MAQTDRQRQAKWRRNHPVRSRSSARLGQKRRRDALRVAKPVGLTYPALLPADDGPAMIAWARSCLVVPEGHHLAGTPMAVPPYGEKFILSALSPECRDALLCMGRKGAKTAIIASVVLYFLVGPGRRRGWRCALASTSRETAGELRSQIEAIARASALKGIRFWKRSSPAITTECAEVDVLSCDKNAAIARGADLVCCDEIGKYQEKDRELLNSLRASLAARHGRFIAISIYGSGPHVPEFVARRDHDGVCVHLYQPPLDSDITSEEAWHQGNPSIRANIKSLSHMRASLKRVLSSVGDQSYFRSEEMNLPGAENKELLCSPDDWRKCVVEPSRLPPREGRAWLGLDCGGSSSLTAACVLYENGRAEFYAALPGTPSLEDRGAADGCGSLYSQARARGELRTYGGRVTPVRDFLAGVIHSLVGVDVVGGASDRFRRAEVLQLLEDPKTGVEFPWEFVPMGCGERGSADVRSLQKMVLEAEIKTLPNLLFANGLSSAIIRRDGNSNPGLVRSGRGRIDLVSAAVLAAGLRSASSDGAAWGVSRVSV